MRSGWGRGAGGSVGSPLPGVPAARAARGDTGRASRRVSPPGPVCRPRIEQEAVPATQKSRRGQARGAQAFQGDATGLEPGTREPGAFPKAARWPGPRGPLEAESHAFGGKKTCGDTGRSAAGARAWQGWEVTFGALVTTGGLQRGAEGKRNKAGSRSRRPQLPGAPVFPATS